MAYHEVDVMTAPDALTVLRELHEKCSALARMSCKMGPNPYGDGVNACRELIDLYIARLEREQAETKPVCLHLNVTHTTNVVTGGFGGSFCRDCNAKVDQVWRKVP